MLLLKNANRIFPSSRAGLRACARITWQNWRSDLADLIEQNQWLL